MNLLKKLFQRPAIKQEIDEELRFHIEQRTAENIAAGMSAEEAAREARKSFGNLQSVREECREKRGASLGENTLRDLRFAFRQLLKNPGFTAVAVLSLALGIGAGTAVFSLVNAILLSSLPVPNPQDLRVLNWSGTDFTKGYDGELLDDGPSRRKGNAFSYTVFLALQKQCADQADIFGYVPLTGVAARARHEAIGTDGLMVSGNFFSGMGVRPLLGRLLGEQDESGAAVPAVVVSYRWWERQFDLDPGALGQPVVLNGKNFTVVGVLPQEFPGIRQGAETDFYIPLAGGDPDRWRMPLMARLKPGVDDTRLRAAMEVVFTRETETIMKQPKLLVTDGRAGPDLDRRRYRGPLLLLLGVVGVVLLVACANLAGLSLARGAARHHEFAVRAALGAGRWPLVRQSLTESGLVAIIGGGIGVVIAVWGKTAFSRLLSGSADGLHYAVHLDLKVLGFALAVSLVAALLSGLLPALRAASVDPKAGLSDRASLGTHRLRAGRILVVAQIALTMLLLVGAGLYVRTLSNLAQINPGFAAENLLLFKLNPGDAGFQEARSTAFFDRALQSLSAVPGVKSVALTQYPLLSGGSWTSSFVIPGHPKEGGGEWTTHMLTVSETFFSTFGVPVLLGRSLRPGDAGEAPKVVVVNEAFARKFFPGEYPVGQMLRRDDDNWQIVGVCRDIKYADIKAEVSPTVYLSFRQKGTSSAFLALRTGLQPFAVATAARKMIAAIDPDIPLTDLSTQIQIRNGAFAQQRMFAILCGSLAVFAVLLSCIGLYGLMAYNVSRRAREFGVRMALGATRGRIAGPILREAVLLSALGVSLGVPLVLALTRLIQTQLYGVQALDFTTICSAIALLLVLSFFVTWIPAHRAASVNPIEALRNE